MLVLVRNAYQRLCDRFRGAPRFAGFVDSLESHLTITAFEFGPFAVVVTDPAWPENPAFPIVVCPPSGYASKATAVAYAMQLVGRSRPYKFAVAQCKSEAQFRVFCSWG